MSALAWPSAAPAGALTAQVVLATPSPSPGELDPNDVSPGLLGFLVIFGVVLLCIPLFRSMSGKIRRVERRAEAAGDDDAPGPAEDRPADTP